jgi:hypothetical protein
MAKRGNPGYGKLEMIRENVDKFSPVFWSLMEKMSKSKSREDQRLFIQEFNKLQVRMIPQQIGGVGDEPIQITWQQSQSHISPGNGRPTSTSQSNAG